MTIRNKELIQAVLDGKEVQWRTAGSSGPWKDFGNTQEAIQWLADDLHVEYRLKPEPLVRWIMLDSLAHARGSYDYESMEMKGCKVLRLELDPETLEVISATTEAP